MRQLFVSAVTGVLLTIFAAAQTPVQKETDLFRAVADEKDPAKKLSLLAAWSDAYPESQFRRERNLHYVASWSALEARAIAPGAPADSVTQGERAAQAMVQKSPSLFAPAMAPDNIRPEDWEIARQEALRQAHAVLAAIASNRKEFSAAEGEFLKLLEMVPDDGATAMRLGTAIVNQRQPARYPTAIFYVARAESLLTKDTDKQAARQYLEKVYEAYHGDLTGLDQVRIAAAKSWAPPPDWSILSASEIAQDQAAKDVKFREQFPDIAIWRDIKARLTAADGAEYFAQNMKNSETPPLKGRIIEVPNTRELLVAIDTSAEATLRLDAPLKLKPIPGSTVQFTGVAVSFTAQPYMVILDVESKALKIAP